MNSVSVSVVIPTFNRLELLRQTVLCLEEQTLKDAEFIVVDDGSDADTISFLKATSTKDARFQIVAKPPNLPKGCQASKNFALTFLKGKYVVFLDSDDLLSKDCLENRKRFLESHSDYDIAVGNQAIIDENSNQITWVNTPTKEISDLQRFVALVAPLDIPWVNGGCAIRVSTLNEKRIGYRPEFRWEDAAFHFECLANGLSAKWMPRSNLPDAYYRIHGSSMGTDLWQQQAAMNCQKLLNWMKESLNSKNLLNVDIHEQFRKNFIHLCVIRPVDQKFFSTAMQLIKTDMEFLTTRDRRRLLWFTRLRKISASFPRARFYVNKFVRSFFPECFNFNASKHGAVPCEALPNIESLRHIIPYYSPAK